MDQNPHSPMATDWHPNGCNNGQRQTQTAGREGVVAEGGWEGSNEEGRIKLRTMDSNKGVGNDWRKLWHCLI